MNLAQANDSPVILPVTPDKIPTLLKSIPQWIGWKVGKQKQNGKYDKLPVNCKMIMCNAHDPKNWMNFGDAVDRYEKGNFSGIGFVLNGEPIETDNHEQMYLVGIDMDHCVHVDEAGHREMSEEVSKVWHSLNCPYLEFSPSGTGVRMFVLSRQKINSSNRDGHEMYIDRRYLTLTGCGHGEVKEATDAILVIHAEWFPGKQAKTKPVSRSGSSMVSAPSETSDEITKLHNALAYVSADINRDDWRNIVWSIKSSGWECAEEIAREWSESAPERYTDDGFDTVWNSFDPDGGITLGTLYHHAQLAGWHNHANVDKDQDEGDILNGRLFAENFRNKLIFIYETNEVLQFTSAGWVHAPPGEADRSAKTIVKCLRSEAAQLFTADPAGGDTKRKLAHAARSSTEPRIRAMITMTQSEPGMTVRLSEFDADPNLLGVVNGILDLRSGKLLPTSPEYLVSMRARAKFEPGASCDKWIEFLDTVQPDKGVQRLLQQLVGVFLTGDAGMQKLIIIYGLGANGKSTFIEVAAWMLGDYCLRIATEMLMHHQRSPQGPSPDIVSLKGRRLTYCNEVEEGRRLDEARVKELTGGDTLTGRSPYAKHSVTFSPTHNLVMVGNHMPEVHDTSHGMWRRMLLIPFDVTIPTHMQDPRLVEKLKAEASGILEWAMVGYQDFHRHGLMIPKVISAATDAYKNEEDLLGEWLQEHCVVAPGARVPIAECYKSYRSWADSRGHKSLAQSRLTKRMKERGFERDAGKRHYLGLELNQEGEVAARMFY